MWTGLVEQLQDNYTCVSVDLPGFGNSYEATFQSIPEVASQVLTVLDEISQDQFVVFGHSMGGYIAIEMLAQRTNKFNGLSMVHSTVFADDEDKKEVRLRSNKFLEENNAEAFLKPFISKLVAKSKFQLLRADLWDLVRDTPKASIVAGNQAMMNRQDHTSTLKKCELPVHFIIGEEDVFIPKQHLLTQASLCQTSTVTILENVGHLSVLEEEQLTHREIRKYLKFNSRLNQ
jgi:pimeloyl-ACP methyl ester carboxylesterase